MLLRLCAVHEGVSEAEVLARAVEFFARHHVRLPRLADAHAELRARRAATHGNSWSHD